MYFDKFKTENEVKERYRLLAKKLHPDVGGDSTLMKEINLEYEKTLKTLKDGYSLADLAEQYTKSHNRWDEAHARAQSRAKKWGERSGSWTRNPNPFDDGKQTQQQKKVNAVLVFAGTNKNFDKSFILSLNDRLADGKMLTPAQEAALDNIINKFKITEVNI